MQSLTRESVSAAFAKLVEQYGEDHVYMPPSGPSGDCVYFCDTPDGLEPSCLWGHILMDHDMTYNELESHGSKSIRLLLRDIDVEDVGLKLAAQRAQSLQDTGATWGTAYAAFKRILRECPIE